jgi:hypothetical protein
MDENIRTIGQINPNALIINGFNNAIIGYVDKYTTDPVALYDYNKIIETLINRDGFTEEEAMEFYSHNILPNYEENNSPIVAFLFKSE